MKIINGCFIILSILWMLLIFSFSSQKGGDSAGLSEKISKAVINIFTDYDSLEPDKQEEVLSGVQTFIRKSAHFCEYLILGTLVMLSLYTFPYIIIGLHRSSAFATGISFLYGCSDEIHQNFVSGRMMSGIDVLIDTLGALCGCIIVYLILKRKQKNQ